MSRSRSAPTAVETTNESARLGITAPPNPRVDGNGTHTEFLKPAVLIYEPQADGSMALVAVENLVFLKSWHAAGNTAPPSFQGVPFDRMVDDPATELDEAHAFEPHYDRHVWLDRQNPQGIFAQFNPAVTCAHHKGGAHHDHAAAEPAKKELPDPGRGPLPVRPCRT
jgi:hypothetical protein